MHPPLSDSGALNASGRGQLFEFYNQHFVRFSFNTEIRHVRGIWCGRFSMVQIIPRNHFNIVFACGLSIGAGMEVFTVQTLWKSVETVPNRALPSLSICLVPNLKIDSESISYVGIHTGRFVRFKNASMVREGTLPLGHWLRQEVSQSLYTGAGVSL